MYRHLIRGGVVIYDSSLSRGFVGTNFIMVSKIGVV